MWRRMCLCVLCVRARASQRPTPPLKLQLERLVDRSGRFSRVITSCAFLSRAQQLLEIIHKQTKLEQTSGHMRGKYFQPRPIFYATVNVEHVWNMFL